MADSYGPEGKGPQNGGPQNAGQQDNYTYRYNYSFGSGRGTPPPQPPRPPKNSGGWGDWIGIGILFCIPSAGITQIIAIVWAVRKILAIDARQRNRYKQEAKNAAKQATGTFVDDVFSRTFGEDFFTAGKDGKSFTSGKGTEQSTGSAQQQGRDGTGGTTYHYQYRQASQPQQKKQPPKAEPWEQKSKPQPDAWNVRDPAENKRKKARKVGGGKGLTFIGGCLTGLFGLATFVLALIFAVEGFYDAEMLIPIGICGAFMAGGLGTLFSGISKNRRGERWLNYLAYIGANREVALAPMAASFGVSVSKLCKDLRQMLAKGVLPTGYLDLAEGKLYLTEMGYHAPEPQREAPPEETAQEAAAREDDILREIRQVNDDIPDEVMSVKIDRIEEITGKILKYQKEHPNKEGQLRTFLNYYLPTTLKILRAYAQLDAQGIEGENISAAKKRIEDMMDQVVSGFEKQLDKLFQDDAMDITSDVEVLENMLKKDGLSDEGGITMTL